MGAAFPELALEEKREIAAAVRTRARPRPGLSLLPSSLALGGCAASYALAALRPQLLPAAVLLLALSLTVLSIVVHECAHGSLLESPALNAALGFVAGVLVWTPFGSYRRGHVAHHTWVGGAPGRDPTASPRREVQPSVLLDLVLWTRVLPVFFWGGVYLPYLIYDARSRSPLHGARQLAGYVANLAAIAAAHGALALGLGLERFLILEGGAFLGWGILYENLFTLNQHVGLAALPEGKERYSPAEQVNFSRSVRLPLSAFFFHFNLHKEHHLFPGFNHQLLPHVAAELLARRPELLAFTDSDLGLVRRHHRRSHEVLSPRAGDGWREGAG